MWTLRCLAALSCLCLVAAAVRAQLASSAAVGVHAEQSQPPQADALVNEGQQLFEKAQYAQARDAAARALELYHAANSAAGVGRASHLLGLAAEFMGDAAEARASLDRAIVAFETAGDRRGRALATLGLLRAMRTETTRPALLYERSIDDARAVGDEVLLGSIFHSWGDALFAAGDYDKAVEKLDAALVQFETYGDPVTRGTVHNSIGRLYRAHGRLDLALGAQLQALALHEKSKATFNHLQSLNAVAVTYQALGDHAAARPYFERALRLAEGAESVRVQDFVRANFSSTLFEEGNYAAAAQLLEQVIAHGVDIYPSVRLRNLSMAYARLGRHDEALARAQQAVDVCPERMRTDCINALGQRAMVHAALGHKDPAAADLTAALADLETVRAQLVPRDFLRQQFAQSQRVLYTQRIALQLDAGDPGGALATAELARARAFLDLLAGNDIQLNDSPAPLPRALRGSPSEPRSLATGSEGAEDASLHLVSSASTHPLDAQGLITLAQRLGSTLLLYWVAADAVFIWVVQPDGTLRAARASITQSKLRDLVRASGPPTAGPAASSPTSQPPTTRGDSPSAVALVSSAPSRELYDALIRPVRETLPRDAGSLLTIVPDGVLAGLSFAALQDERGRYLLEDHALHYVAAASVLRFTATRRRPDARRSNVALVADPVRARRSKLDPVLPALPGARAEVRAISLLFPPTRATTVEGARASLARVRELIADSGVLHFATHALVMDQSPFASFLALASTPGDPASDDTLTAREIYGLKLNADLVVLSACRSGGGIITGDGIATFTRAFISAGAPSVVTSLWDVADQPTNRLLPAFYRAWLQGASKAAALRSAQLRLLADLRAGRVLISTAAGAVVLPEHPVFWGGFILNGEPD